MAYWIIIHVGTVDEAKFSFVFGNGILDGTVTAGCTG